MLLKLPIDILHEIDKFLIIQDVYNLLLTNTYFNNVFGKDKFKKKYCDLLNLEKYINKNYNKFKHLIQYVSKDRLEKTFIYSLNNITTVWMNDVCGTYDMKYIAECMYNGLQINTINKINSEGLHFYRFFYNSLLECIIIGDKKQTQKNIDNCAILRNLHTNFKPFPKKK